MKKAKRKRRAARSGAPAAGAAPEREAPRAPREANSVEDPLEDWEDDEDERWLRERGGTDIEKPDDQTYTRSSSCRATSRESDPRTPSARTRRSSTRKTRRLIRNSSSKPACATSTTSPIRSAATC